MLHALLLNSAARWNWLGKGSAISMQPISHSQKSLGMAHCLLQWRHYFQHLRTCCRVDHCASHLDVTHHWFIIPTYSPCYFILMMLDSCKCITRFFTHKYSYSNSTNQVDVRQRNYNTAIQVNWSLPEIIIVSLNAGDIRRCNSNQSIISVGILTCFCNCSNCVRKFE